VGTRIACVNILADQMCIVHALKLYLFYSSFSSHLFVTVPHAAAQGRDPRAIVAIIPPFVTAASVLPDGYNRGVRCVDVGSFDLCVHLVIYMKISVKVILQRSRIITVSI